MNYEEIKAEVLAIAKGKNACREALLKAVIAVNMQQLSQVMKDNFHWCCENRLLTHDTIIRWGLAEFGIRSNEDVASGHCLASGNAMVEASGNATVEVSDNATVLAYGNATVEVSDNATVLAYGNATVRAFDNATVLASGNATVRAYGNATVRASGNATVLAYGNATVLAYGNATVLAFDNAYVSTWSSAECQLHDKAIARIKDVLIVTASGQKIQL